MLPRLRAEEALRDVTRLSIGTGAVPPDEQRRVKAAWSRQADEGARTKPVSATPQDLSALGIGYHVEPTRP